MLTVPLAVAPREMEMQSGPSDRVLDVERDGSLTLPPWTLAQLRLLRPEPFLVLADGSHAVHLIRAGSGPPALLQAERITLQGSLEGFGIADLFSLLNMSRRSGMLLLISEQIQKTVWFRQGEIVFAATNRPEERLGQVLYRTGKLSLEGLLDAERHLAPGKRFGAVLLERGHLDAPTLAWGVKYQVEEIIYSVFRLTHGSFFFLDGAAAGTDLGQLSIDTNSVLMEGYQRVDELGLIAEHIRGRDTVLRPTGRRPEGKLHEQLLRVLGLVDGSTTVAEIIRGTGWGEFNTFKALYKLIQARLVESTDAPAPATTPREDPLVDELTALVETRNRAFLLLRDVLRAKSVDVDLQRAFDLFVRNASDATRAVFQGVVLGAGRRFDPGQLIDNASHLLLLETASLAGTQLPTVRRRELVDRALSEWTTFQILLVRNLLPEAEARELISYVQEVAHQE
ncbi:MAG TPA: hypothetical protein DD490_12955, partial [Acidobacteria bacterium]|nr:hypothetical protein [Acidobacteriota bacterium]